MTDTTTPADDLPPLPLPYAGFSDLDSPRFLKQQMYDYARLAIKQARAASQPAPAEFNEAMDEIVDRLLGSQPAQEPVDLDRIIAGSLPDCVTGEPMDCIYRVDVERLLRQAAPPADTARQDRIEAALRELLIAEKLDDDDPRLVAARLEAVAALDREVRKP